MAIDEKKLIKTIVEGSDWQAALTEIVTEEGMDPRYIDIVELTNAFVLYLDSIKQFDFRIPARFILIAAVLLRMKCELLMEENEEEAKEEENEPEIELGEIPQLTSPSVRKPTRKVTLNELVGALSKAFELKEKKKTKKLRNRKRVENLIEETEDIDKRITRVLNNIKQRNSEILFSDLVPTWERNEIVKIFIPLLHLVTRSAIECKQKELYSEIIIKLKVDDDEK